ncbi:fasciclin-like arabinogalactan protein 7 [Oryza glaberrima]|nr:fasciclin-like arabinogalactan protein 7 [Oryza glaberrima]
MMESKAAMMVTILLCCSSISPAFAQKHKGPPAAAAVSLPPSPAPSPAAPRHVDLADLLSVAGPFHTFLDLLEKTDVLRTFQSQANGSKDGITVFVPKDAAFASLARSATANLTSDQLKSLALYHALPRYYSLAEFNRLGGAASPVPTLAGGEYTVNVTDDMGTVHVGSMWSNPKISSSVYSTRPVAVYEVDRVLLPMQIFRTDPPMAPSPAPAPDAKPASDAASPLPGKSSSAKAKADDKKSSSSPPSSRRGAGIAGYFLALAASASAGLLLLC